MSIGLASENRLPEAFEAKTHDDGSKVTIQSGPKQKAVINTNSFASVANILSAFSPDGKASLQPGATLAIKDEFSGRSITIVASAIGDVAAALKAFVVQAGEYLPAYEETDATNASSPSLLNEASGTGTTTSDIDADSLAADTLVTHSDEASKTAENPETANAVQVEQTSTTPEKNEPVVAKRRGRPKKNQQQPVQPEAVAAPQEDATLAATAVPTAQVATDVAPKKRGRPKKVVAAVEQTQEEAPVSVEETATDVQSVIQEAPKKRGRPRKDAAPAVQLTPPAAVVQKTPGIESATPSKRRGRPPKATTVQETTNPAKPVSVVKALSSAGKSNLLPSALVEDHISPDLDLDGLPDYLNGLKAFYVIPENNFRVDFTPLVMDPAKRRNVLGVPADGETADMFGYEIKTDEGEHAGWIIVEGENKFVMTGLPELELSNHKNISGAFNRIAFALSSKVSDIHSRAA